jgi:hypothetical protein
MAMNLDGGGSSTLYVGAAGGVVNAPSDGVERTVASHLAVLHKTLPPGEIVGLVCENTFSPCNTPISGAVVTFDDGRTDTTAADGRYAFQNVTPRLACATARKAGYRTNSRCSTVTSGQVQFNSIALMPGQDPPDAGVPDASGIPDDGPGASGDGGLPPDGGMMPPDGAGSPAARGGSLDGRVRFRRGPPPR